MFVAWRDVLFLTGRDVSFVTGWDVSFVTGREVSFVTGRDVRAAIDGFLRCIVRTPYMRCRRVHSAVLGLWYVILGLWYVILGLWYMILGLWYVILKYPARMTHVMLAAYRNDKCHRNVNCPFIVKI